jgi:hypothetical protein
MDFRVQLASAAVGVIIWLSVASALRHARLDPGFAVLWAGIGALLFFMPAYGGLLQWMAGHVFGIIGANHLVYALLFAFLLLYVYYLTEKVSRLNNQVERLIVAVAILEADNNYSRLPLHFGQNEELVTQTLSPKE